MILRNLACAIAACIALAACDVPANLDPSPTPIGELRLGYVKVSAKDTKWVEGSRRLEESVVESAVVDAISERLGRYRGNKWYHITASVEEVLLAPSGPPIVGSLRSGMVIRVLVWDDANAAILNDPPKTFVVFEPTSVSTFLGSGNTREAEEQLVAVSRQAARLIEDWIKSPENSPLPGVGTAPAASTIRQQSKVDGFVTATGESLFVG